MSIPSSSPSSPPSSPETTPTPTTASPGSSREVFLAFARQGVTAFGGPVAHLGYFRTEFVERRRWIDDEAYGELVALCQFLPGPASSQVGMGLGLYRAGLPGALAAWVGFTAPSALLMILAALGFVALGQQVPGVLGGLKAVVVAVVAQALWGMASHLCQGRLRASIALVAAGVTLALTGATTQLGVIAAGALLGLWLIAADGKADRTLPTTTSGLAVGALVLFALLLVGLPWAASYSQDPLLGLASQFYQVGALVFGGGHVVLPLLQAQVVGPGALDAETFIAGYGAAQALPGPMFSFAAFLGAAHPQGGLVAAVVALVMVFLPGALLLLGILAFWARLRTLKRAHGAMAGVNAAVVGLLLATFYDPVLIQGVTDHTQAIIALGAWGLLVLWQWPPWLVVVLGASIGGALGALGVDPSPMVG